MTANRKRQRMIRLTVCLLPAFAALLQSKRINAISWEFWGGFVCKDGGARSGNNGEWRMAGEKKHLINAFIFNIFINNPAFHFTPPIAGKHSQRCVSLPGKCGRTGAQRTCKVAFPHSPIRAGAELKMTERFSLYYPEGKIVIEASPRRILPFYLRWKEEHGTTKGEAARRGEAENKS